MSIRGSEHLPISFSYTVFRNCSHRLQMFYNVPYHFFSDVIFFPISRMKRCLDNPAIHELT